MRALLIALALAALGAGAYFLYQQQQQAEAPAVEAPALPQTDGREALAIFHNVCIAGLQNFAQNQAVATAAGWVAVADDVSPETARIAAVARGADVGATGTVLTVYDHPDHEQYVMLTDLTIQGDRLNGCYVYDFQAAGIPDLVSLQAGLGGGAPQAETHPGIIDSRQWTRPPTYPNVATVRAGHIPRGSPAEEQAGFTGLAFAITSLSQ